MIRFKKGFKYQLEGSWRWKLQGDFTISQDFDNGFYWITQDGWLGAHRGCAWDGATWFPDFDWIMEGSLGHDILHWLIEKGIIPESQNDLIDQELENIINARATPPKIGGRALLKLRAAYVRRATNAVSQKYGEGKPVVTIPRSVSSKEFGQ